jgi:cytohesin
MNKPNLDQQMLDAVVSNDLATVEKLVSQGANINFIDRWGNCAMFTAAWEGNIEALNMYHSLGAVLDLEDNNPMCNAAFNGQLESVRWFIEKGADVNFSFKKTGENALHYTICKTSEMGQRTEIVRLLVDAGTDVNKKTIKGAETLCFMRDAYLKAETPLHRAAAYANEIIIKILIEAGADKSAKDANGDTPISWGSWHLRDSNVLRLLVYGDVAGIG